MKKLSSIAVLLLFFNFTVSPLFWTSSYFGQVTEERADIEGAGNVPEKGSEQTLLYSVQFAFHIDAAQYTHSSNSSFLSLKAVFIEQPTIPPEQTS